MINKIRWWLESWSFRGIKERLYEVWLIIPVVYGVVRWDYTSLLIIMEHWVGRIRDVHEKDKWHCPHSVERNVRNLTICQNLLKRMSTHNYGEAFYDQHDNRWGKSHHFSYPTDESKEYYRMIFHRDKCSTDKEKELEHKEFKYIMEHEEYLYKQDMDYLFRILKKHLRSWWT